MAKNDKDQRPANAETGEQDQKLVGQVEELTKQVSDLSASVVTINSLNDELTGQVDELKTQKAKLEADNDELKSQIEDLQVAAKEGPRTNIKGFVLATRDPFAAGTMRTYLAAAKSNKQAPYLPFVLPYNDPAGLIALESYILRANGGGDTKRAKVAEKVIVKFPAVVKKKK